MLHIIILILLYSTSGAAKSYKSCLDQLAVDTNHSQEQITHILMSCNNQFLIGQTIFLNNNKLSDKMIRTYYPKTTQGGDAPVTEHEKGGRLVEYSKCEEITKNVKKYMKRCQK